MYSVKRTLEASAQRGRWLGKMKHPGLRKPAKESAAVAGDLDFHASKAHRGAIIRIGVFDLLFLRSTAQQIHGAHEDDIGLWKRKNGLVFAVGEGSIAPPNVEHIVTRTTKIIMLTAKELANLNSKRLPQGTQEGNTRRVHNQ